MNELTENPAGTLQAQEKKHVVIVGGGFAGVMAARRLEKQLPAEWEIYLLSNENYLTFNPLLPEVVGASILPSNVVAPLRLIINRTRFRMVQVRIVDIKERVVHYVGHGSGKLRYDHLVLACGQRANIGIVDGMREHGLPLKTLGDALFIRNRIVSRLEHATIEPDPAHRDWLTTFIIVGGGFSGVEVAGEVADFVRAAVPYYKNVHRTNCRVILLHGGDYLLPELPESLGNATARSFSRRGLDVRLMTRVVAVDADGVTLEDGTRIAGGTVICTIGSAPQALAAAIDLPKKRGRFVANADLSVDDRVWAIGDCALVPNRHDGSSCPPTAQFAERQAKVLAENLCATISGKPTREFSYRPKGQLASVGHTKAVAWIYGIRLSGFLAWLLWRGLYLMKIPTLARKARLYLEWSWAMFFPPDISHLSFARTTDRDAFSQNTATVSGENSGRSSGDDAADQTLNDTD